MLQSKTFYNSHHYPNEPIDDACSQIPHFRLRPCPSPPETPAELRCLAQSLQTSRQEKNPPLAFPPSSPPQSLSFLHHVCQLGLHPISIAHPLLTTWLFSGEPSVHHCRFVYLHTLPDLGQMWTIEPILQCQAYRATRSS